MKQLTKNLIQRKDGFTLMELMVVLSITATLIAIAIPFFLGTLEKSKQAVDEAIFTYSMRRPRLIKC